jgi:hypothetical protein
MLEIMADRVARRIKQRREMKLAPILSPSECGTFVTESLRIMVKATNAGVSISNVDLTAHLVLHVFGISLPRKYALVVLDTWGTTHHVSVQMYAAHAALMWLVRAAHPDLVLSAEASAMVMRGLLRSSAMNVPPDTWRAFWRAAMGSGFMDNSACRR